MSDGRGPQRMTRAQFTDAQIGTLTAAYQITKSMAILAARHVAMKMRAADPDAEGRVAETHTVAEVCALATSARRTAQWVHRDLVRFLPPETPPQRSDLEAQILADAMAPGVDLADRVRALDALSGRGAGVQVNVQAGRVDLSRLSDADLDELDRIERLALGDGCPAPGPVVVDADVEPPPHE